MACSTHYFVFPQFILVKPFRHHRQRIVRFHHRVFILLRIYLTCFLPGHQPEDDLAGQEADLGRPEGRTPDELQARRGALGRCHAQRPQGK